MSRDDYGSFIRHYMESDIVPRDPFQTIDFDGVGGLMQTGVDKAARRGPTSRSHLRRTRRRPDSVKFCHKIGLKPSCCRLGADARWRAQAALGK